MVSEYFHGCTYQHSHTRDSYGEKILYSHSRPMQMLYLSVLTGGIRACSAGLPCIARKNPFENQVKRTQHCRTDDAEMTKRPMDPLDRHPQGWS